MKSFFAAHKIASIISAVALVAVAGGSYWYVAANRAPSFNPTVVTQGNVIESVTESGQVVAENSADLSFEEAGQITSVPVNEGQSVAAGQVLAQLDTSSLSNQVAQAQAAVLAAQAVLAQLASGTIPQQLAIDQSTVTGGQSAVASAMSSLAAAEQGAYTAADDAVRNQADNLFSGVQNGNPVFIVPTSNSQFVINIQSQRLALETTLDAWNAAQNATTTNAVALGATALANLNTISSYLDAIAPIVNEATPNSAISATAIAGYKVNIETARTEVSTALSTLTAAQNALAGAQSTLATDQNQLTLAQSGATPQQIEAQKAAVAQAQAAEGNAQVALQHATLVAPFSGTVTNLTANIGQVVSPGVPVVSLTNSTGLKVVVYVSEADVAKIQDGDKANVTLDAYGTGTIFPATVTTIDNAQTVVNGTAAYAVTLHFVSADSRIKAGMTAHATIIAAEHDNVLEVPSNLVINNNSSYFILVQSSTGPVQEPVQIGIVGDNGMTEITSGATAGQSISNF